MSDASPAEPGGGNYSMGNGARELRLVRAPDIEATIRVADQAPDAPMPENLTSDMIKKMPSDAVTRPEMQANIDALRQEMRADSAGVRLDMERQSGEIKALLATMAGQMERLSDKVADSQAQSKDAAEASRESAKSMRWWLVSTGVGTVLAIAAFNATVLSNMVATFESGKNTAQAISEAAGKLQAAQEAVERAASAAVANKPAPK